MKYRENESGKIRYKLNYLDVIAHKMLEEEWDSHHAKNNNQKRSLEV